MAFGVFLNSFPYFLLGMALAWKHLRYGRWHALSVMTALSALQAVSVILLTYSLTPEALDKIKTLHGIIYIILVIASFLWIVRFKMTRLLFIAFFVKYAADFVVAIVKFLTVQMFPGEESVTYGLHYNLIHLALLLFIFPLMLWFIVRVMQKLYVVDSKLWRYLWLVPAAFYALSTIITWYYTRTQESVVFIIINIIIFFISLLVYTLVLETLRTTREMSLKEERERILIAENTTLDRMNRMKTELISTVTHETMTPLAVLSGYAELIASEAGNKGVDEQTAKDLYSISEEAQRIAGLMDELNKHGVKEGKSEPIDKQLAKTRVSLTELTDGTARLYTPILQRVNTSLSVSFPADLPDVFVCSNEITQVFFNLLQNARNHTEDGAVTITACVEGEFVLVAVSDTGSGISPKILPRIFNRGVTSRKDGSGLGLPICKEIITRHGGTIEIKSEQGKGTTIWFTLPLWREGIRDE